MLCRRVPDVAWLPAAGSVVDRGAGPSADCTGVSPAPGIVHGWPRNGETSASASTASSPEPASHSANGTILRRSRRCSRVYGPIMASVAAWNTAQMPTIHGTSVAAPSPKTPAKSIKLDGMIATGNDVRSMSAMTAVTPVAMKVARVMGPEVCPPTTLASTGTAAVNTRIPAMATRRWRWAASDCTTRPATRDPPATQMTTPRKLSRCAIPSHATQTNGHNTHGERRFLMALP